MSIVGHPKNLPHFPKRLPGFSEKPTRLPEVYPYFWMSTWFQEMPTQVPKKPAKFPNKQIKVYPVFRKVYLVSRTRHIRIFCMLEGKLQILKTWWVLKVDIRRKKKSKI